MINRDPRETLNRIREQADNATPGPWEIDLDGDIQGRRKGCYPDPEMDPMVGTLDRPEDTAFIAASRTTVPALLDLADAVLDLADDLNRDGNAFMSDADPSRAKAAYAHAARIRAAATTALEGGNHD